MQVILLLYVCIYMQWMDTSEVQACGGIMRHVNTIYYNECYHAVMNTVLDSGYRVVDNIVLNS